MIKKTRTIDLKDKMLFEIFVTQNKRRNNIRLGNKGCQRKSKNVPCGMD